MTKCRNINALKGIFESGIVVVTIVFVRILGAGVLLKLLIIKEYLISLAQNFALNSFHGIVVFGTTIKMLKIV
ncbi:hypothetical protein GCM10008940_29510 [Microbulbifer agarilyticus]